MKFKKIAFLIACFSFGLGLFLRLYKVPSIPPSLSWDEVSIGYNAYSILKTGRDEHGVFMPVTAFAAYGDYKPIVPIYLTVPSVALFGLTEYAVRLPSAILGAFTIPVVYLLVTELLPGVSAVAGISSLLLAISPWHINLSRAGFEANEALFFVILGTWLILRARKAPKLWIMCWIPFVLAVNTFNSARYFSPILAIGLLVFCRKSIQKSTKQFLIGIVIALLLVSPLVPYLLSKDARLRFTEVNIFSDIGVVEKANARIAIDKNSLLANILHNRRLGYAREYLVHFLDNLEPWFLFVRGDGNPKFSIQDVGQLYLVEAPLLFLGIFLLFRDHPDIAWLLVFWLLAAIVPAATARETPHALRIENSLPTWQIFISYGIVTLVTHIKKYWKTIAVVGIVILYALNVGYYLHNYYGYYPIEFSGEWQYGYREAISFIQPIKDKYQHVVMTDVIGRPYMYVLFYEHDNPSNAWNTIHGSFDAAGLYNVDGLGKYQFIRGGATGELKKETLYIVPANETPTGVRILNTVKLLNGVPVLTIFDKP